MKLTPALERKLPKMGDDSPGHLVGHGIILWLLLSRFVCHWKTLRPERFAFEISLSFLTHKTNLSN